MRRLRFLAMCGWTLMATAAMAQQTATVATPDAFPTPGTSHVIAGELTMVDHVNRMGILRCDRLDSRIKYHQDLPLAFSMLPYGAIFYNGATASLADIPLGTHLHGWFHLGPAGNFPVELMETDYAATVKNQPIDRSPDSPLSQALRLEDDFTFYQRQNQGWKILAIDSAQQKLTVEKVPLEKESRLPELSGFPTVEGLRGKQILDYTLATRVWKANKMGDWADLAVGQTVLFNLTWATMYGPGRVTDLWIDPASRAAASERQQRVFDQQIRDRGFPAMVSAIEYLEKGAGIVTVEFYTGFETKHADFFPSNQSARVIVAESSLRTHDAHNDGQSVRVTELINVSESLSNPIIAPGSSGFRLRFRMNELLEGIRPGRTVRLQAGSWDRHDLPREEKIHPFDIRPPLLLPPTE
ncbi:hypothetical protein [Aporhodopirellula aestuarii]|uniref:Uncharacterized protein n=1 Tax=Aporhodopirellula aestuarii TaxID=2950107 RepID=A0ABT0U992_9BACT|nr:hypothetical protein [Aporhodopirellula aestuarii]MCM2373458.1 hypothetical protein [Aporhodopirellula aestuarii]